MEIERQPTTSMESLAICMIRSTVLFEAKCMVVSAFQPSETLPYRMGILGSEYGERSRTQVVIPVWLIVRRFVMSAGPGGGGMRGKGWSDAGERTEAEGRAEPFLSVQGIG